MFNDEFSSSISEILINQGAEAKILVGNFLGKKCIIKERFVKKYRLPEIDTKLTKQRIINESRNLMRAFKNGINTPFIYFVDLVNRRIFTEYIENAVMIKDLLRCIYVNEQSVTQNEILIEMIIKELGGILGKLHESDLVHGDLTTSNMLIKLDHPLSISNEIEKVKEIIKNQNFETIYLIDFGLSYCSQNVEDKAVDLYVLKRAIISANTKSVEIFDKMMEVYKNTYSKGDIILNHLNKVEMRGRKKVAFG